MTPDDILNLVGEAKSHHVWDTQQIRSRQGTAAWKILPTKRIWLAAALIAVMGLLVGCTVAYAQGWFTEFFAARSQRPLSDIQIGFIQENEQIIQETQAKGGWTVELKSTLCDGSTAFAIFSITAPEGVDLEGVNLKTPADSDSIIPGNSGMTAVGGPMFRTTMDQGKNLIWQYGTAWKADNDGKANTLNYAVTIDAAKLQPELDMGEPFDPNIEFEICFRNFVHEWRDQEVWEATREEYAGQDYIICGEDMEGLYKSEILVEEEWEFTITFNQDGQAQERLELVPDDVMTWAKVIWKLDEEPLTYRTGDGIAPVKITSFVLSPLGADVTYEFEEPMIGAFIEYQDHFGYEDRPVYAVMKDGSKIALHTHGTGTRLMAETPIVLSELDYVLLGDGGKLTSGGEWIEPVLY